MLYDVMLYQHNGGHLLECDARVALDIVKHLKKYALRSKVYDNPLCISIQSQSVHFSSGASPARNVSGQVLLVCSQPQPTDISRERS